MTIDLGDNLGVIEAEHSVELTPTKTDPNNMLHIYKAQVDGITVVVRHWNQDRALENFKRGVIHRTKGADDPNYWKPKGNFTGD